PAAARARWRRRDGGTRSLDQGRGVAGREEADALSICVAAQDERAEPKRPEEQLAHALGRLEAAVLCEEAQVPAQVLDVHPPAMRGAADVHDLGAGKEQHLPPG